MKAKVITIILGIVCLVIIVVLGVKSYNAYTLQEEKDALKKLKQK